MVKGRVTGLRASIIFLRLSTLGFSEIVQPLNLPLIDNTNRQISVRQCMPIVGVALQKVLNRRRNVIKLEPFAVPLLYKPHAIRVAQMPFTHLLFPAENHISDPRLDCQSKFQKNVAPP